MDFETQQLARLRTGRSAMRLVLTRALHRLLFLGTTLVVWAGHRPVFRASGIGFGRFWRSCWREFGSDLAAMDPRSLSIPRTAAAGKDWRGAALPARGAS